MRARLPTWLFLVLAVGCGGAGSATSSQESSTLPAAGAECQTDTDCACGKDKESGQCAIGPAAKIDTSQQCPDFCTGIAGHLQVVCRTGKCQQVKK